MRPAHLFIETTLVFILGMGPPTQKRTTWSLRFVLSAFGVPGAINAIPTTNSIEEEREREEERTSGLRDSVCEVYTLR